MSDVNTDSNMVKLMTSDKKVLEVSPTVAKQSEVISHAIDLSAEDSKNFAVPIATERVLKKVTLKTSDGKDVKVSLTVAKQSKTISDLIEDAASTEDPIPLINITERILKMVIQYCKKHLEAADGSKTVTMTKERSSTSQLSPWIYDGKLRNWDRQFVDSVETETLLDLMQAATYLNIQALLYATCRRISDKMKGKKSVLLV